MQYITYSNKIVLFLRYDEYIHKAKYNLYVNDKCVAKFSNAHYVLSSLEYDTIYKVEVLYKDKTIFKEEIKTSRKKNIINVDVDNRGIKVVTSEIQKYIDQASENDVLYFPEGIYLTGALFLKSNQEIYLEKGCIILGSSDANDYLPKIPSRFEGILNYSYASLINVGSINKDMSVTASNIIVRGEGKIFGGNLKLHDDIIAKELPFVTTSDYRADLVAGRVRGRLIHIANTDNVIIDGIKMGYSPSWNLHVIFSKNIFIHSCKFESFKIHNGDGIDIDSCYNSYLFNNVFNTGDDCIAIKSGKNPESNLINIPSKNVYIFDNKALRGHGCSIGSELSGGIENIDIYNCDFASTLYGIHIKTTRKRGGFAKNIRVKDSKFSSINIRKVPYNDDGESANSLTTFKDFLFENIEITGIMYLTKIKTDTTKYIDINGFEDDITAFSNYQFKNITLLNYENNPKGYSIENASEITLENIQKF